MSGKQQCTEMKNKQGKFIKFVVTSLYEAMLQLCVCVGVFEPFTQLSK